MSGHLDFTGWLAAAWLLIVFAWSAAVLVQRSRRRRRHDRLIAVYLDSLEAQRRALSRPERCGSVVEIAARRPRGSR